MSEIHRNLAHRSGSSRGSTDTYGRYRQGLCISGKESITNAPPFLSNFRKYVTLSKYVHYVLHLRGVFFVGPAEDFSSVSYREFLGVRVFDRTQMGLIKKYMALSAWKTTRKVVFSEVKQPIFFW